MPTDPRLLSVELLTLAAFSRTSAASVRCPTGAPAKGCMPCLRRLGRCPGVTPGLCRVSRT